MLAAQLYRIAQQHRASRDFTRPTLQRALREVIACMTVYRTYVAAIVGTSAKPTIAQ